MVQFKKDDVIKHVRYGHLWKVSLINYSEMWIESLIIKNMGHYVHSDLCTDYIYIGNLKKDKLLGLLYTK